jgi:preprotein translocase subunit SecB
MSQEKTAAGAEQNAQMHIQRLYVKDMSFEAPNSPEVFQVQSWQPQIEVQLNTQAKPLADNLHEVVMTITVTAKLDDKVAYLVEVAQAGVFSVINFPQDQLQYLMGAYCPAILFPYARQVVAEAIMNGGFPVLHLAPMNFEALHAQQMMQQQADAASGEGIIQV